MPPLAGQLGRVEDHLIPTGGRSGEYCWLMVACIGPLATISCELGQARKGAAAAVDLGAGVWLVQVAALPRAGCYTIQVGRNS